MLLALLMRLAHSRRDHAPAGQADARRLLSDRSFLTLIAITGLVALAADFFVTGISVYFLAQLHAPPWLPGTALALLTGLTSVGATIGLRATRRLYRTTAMALGAVLYVVWCGASLAAVVVPSR